VCDSARLVCYAGADVHAWVERQRDRETERQRDRETERQRDRETEFEGVRGKEYKAQYTAYRDN
jgi:hypothetical protein